MRNYPPARKRKKPAIPAPKKTFSFYSARNTSDPDHDQGFHQVLQLDVVHPSAGEFHQGDEAKIRCRYRELRFFIVWDLGSVNISMGRKAQIFFLNAQAVVCPRKLSQVGCLMCLSSFIFSNYLLALMCK
jgi:hypothetical protein